MAEGRTGRSIRWSKETRTGRLRWFRQDWFLGNNLQLSSRRFRISAALYKLFARKLGILTENASDYRFFVSPKTQKLTTFWSFPSRNPILSTSCNITKTIISLLFRTDKLIKSSAFVLSSYPKGHRNIKFVYLIITGVTINNHVLAVIINRHW